MEAHSGPLPTPGTLQGYKDLGPEVLEQILAMADRQQRHDHRMEVGILHSETAYRVLGILGAVGVVGGMIAGSVACAMYGHTAAAVALHPGAPRSPACSCAGAT